jgi:hypothetical protein
MTDIEIAEDIYGRLVPSMKDPRQFAHAVQSEIAFNVQGTADPLGTVLLSLLLPAGSEFILFNASLIEDIGGVMNDNLPILVDLSTTPDNSGTLTPKGQIVKNLPSNNGFPLIIIQNSTLNDMYVLVIAPNAIGSVPIDAVGNFFSVGIEYLIETP